MRGVAGEMVLSVAQRCEAERLREGADALRAALRSARVDPSPFPSFRSLVFSNPRSWVKNTVTLWCYFSSEGFSSPKPWKKAELIGGLP